MPDWCCYEFEGEKRVKGSRENKELRRALIVEDDRSTAELTKSVLEGFGFESTICADGLEAIEVLKRDDFRIVFSDWHMPKMDGVELCKEVRKLDRQYTYFVLLTSAVDKQERVLAYDAGVDDMLHKPLDAQELGARLKVAERILKAEQELTNVTDRLRVANANMEVASRRFEDLFHGLPVAGFTLDVEGTIHDWNREAEACFGIEAPAASFQNIETILGKPSGGFWSVDFVQRVADSRKSARHQWSLIRTGRPTLYFDVSLYPFNGANGEAAGIICTNVDITERVLAQRQIEAQMVELESMNAKLAELSVTDGLTGIRNRRHMQDVLESHIQSIERTDSPVSFILLDVDFFKKFNDSFGHVAGDGVLKTVARVLHEHSPAPFMAARYGGEEFAIVLPETDKDEAMQLAEAFRAAIEAVPWVERQVTASFGVSTTLDPTLSVREIVEQADAGLYLSKERGRNQVTHFDETDQAKAA